MSNWNFVLNWVGLEESFIISTIFLHWVRRFLSIPFHCFGNHNYAQFRWHWNFCTNLKREPKNRSCEVLQNYGNILLTLCSLGISHAFFCCLLIFSKSTFSKNSLRNTIWVSDWIQIRPKVLLGLIWVQTVWQISQQTTLELSTHIIPFDRK